MTTDFQTFWDAYALKRDRIAAERAWKKLSVKDRKAALGGIAAYRATCEQQGIHMMYAQGYLTHRRWEDDPSPVRSCFSPHGTPARNRRQSDEMPSTADYDEITTW